jgi:hypothetical protein
VILTFDDVRVGMLDVAAALIAAAAILRREGDA